MESNMKTQRALVKYVNAATDLAEAVKRCIQYNESVIDDDVVKKLSTFAAAAMAVDGLTEALIQKTNKITN